MPETAERTHRGFCFRRRAVFNYTVFVARALRLLCLGLLGSDGSVLLEELADRFGGIATLSDGPHNETLPAAAIACGEDAGLGSCIRVWAFVGVGLYVLAAIELTSRIINMYTMRTTMRI